MRKIGYSSREFAPFAFDHGIIFTKNDTNGLLAISIVLKDEWTFFWQISLEVEWKRLVFVEEGEEIVNISKALYQHSSE